jgi:hypothetical protein
LDVGQNVGLKHAHPVEHVELVLVQIFDPALYVHWHVPEQGENEVVVVVVGLPVVVVVVGPPVVVVVEDSPSP